MAFIKQPKKISFICLSLYSTTLASVLLAIQPDIKLPFSGKNLDTPKQKKVKVIIEGLKKASYLLYLTLLPVTFAMEKYNAP